MSKPYEIKIEERGDYLYALVGGEKLTAQISASYWNEIAEQCFDHDIRKIMIEKEFEETVSAEEMLRMADHLGQLLPNRRIAFLDRFHHDDINELGKRLARNRDVMMQIFATRDEAEKWLRAN